VELKRSLWNTFTRPWNIGGTILFLILESLPKGERFAELIIQAAQQCDMLIVVVSNEYFISMASGP